MSYDDAYLQTLAQRLGEVLAARGWRLTLAESCTGGWIAKAVTDIAGSSGWFERGFVTYSNEAKQELLGVDAELIGAHGAVSEPVALAMARGALAHSRADVAAAVSGIAGPGGGSADKPVGTVCFGWALPGGKLLSERRLFSGDREEIRRRTVAHALERLLAELGAPVEG